MAEGLKDKMGNPISPETKIGASGELFVQLQLLQYDIQAAIPLKDSGNDLIAIKGKTVKYLQVKTTTNRTRFDLRGMKEKFYHVAALVKLVFENKNINFAASEIFLLTKEEVRNRDSIHFPDLRDFRIERRVESIWGTDVQIF